MRVFGIGALALAAAIGLSGPAHAVDVLGSREVAYGSDTDVISAPGTKRYGAVRLCVTRHAVRFTDVDVVFGNGGKQDVPVRRVIAAGECTRWVNLRGPRRNIARVVLRYDTYGDNGLRAVVTAKAR